MLANKLPVHDLSLLKLLPDLAGPDQLREEPVVAGLVSDPPGDDGGMDSQDVREVDHAQGRRLHPDHALLPLIARDQRFLRPLVGLGFSYVVAWQVQIVDEAVGATIKVAADVRQLVQEAAPEVVDAIVAQGETDDRRPPREPKGGAVQVRLREVALHPQGDPVVG